MCVDVFAPLSSIAPPPFDPAVLDVFKLPVFDMAIDLKVEGDTQFLLNHIQARFKAGFEGVRFGSFFHPHFNAVMPKYAQMDFALRAPSEMIGSTSNRARHTQILLASLVNGIVNLYDGQNASTETLKHLTDATSSSITLQRGSGPLIGINTGSGAPTRDWPLENYKALTQQLVADHNATIVLIGSRHEAEDAAALIENLPAQNVVNLTGKMPLTELPGIIHQLDLYIGHDTGITHLASVMGQRTLCLHAGVTPCETFGPVGQNVTILKCVNLPCSPCGLRELSHCNFGHQCMRSITVDRVSAEITKILDLGNVAVANKLASGGRS